MLPRRVPLARGRALGWPSGLRPRAAPPPDPHPQVEGYSYVNFVDALDRTVDPGVDSTTAVACRAIRTVSRRRRRKAAARTGQPEAGDGGRIQYGHRGRTTEAGSRSIRGTDVVLAGRHAAVPRPLASQPADRPAPPPCAGCRRRSPTARASRPLSAQPHRVRARGPRSCAPDAPPTPAARASTSRAAAQREARAAGEVHLRPGAGRPGPAATRSIDHDAVAVDQPLTCRGPARTDRPPPAAPGPRRTRVDGQTRRTLDAARPAADAAHRRPSPPSVSTSSSGRPTLRRPAAAPTWTRRPGRCRSPRPLHRRPGRGQRGRDRTRHQRDARPRPRPAPTTDGDPGRRPRREPVAASRPTRSTADPATPRADRSSGPAQRGRAGRPSRRGPTRQRAARREAAGRRPPGRSPGSSAAAARAARRGGTAARSPRARRRLPVRRPPSAARISGPSMVTSPAPMVSTRSPGAGPGGDVGGDRRPGRHEGHPLGRQRDGRRRPGRR